MAETAALTATIPDRLGLSANMRDFLKPTSDERMLECYALVSILGTDKTLLKEVFRQYSQLHGEQTEQARRITLNSRLGALCEQYKELRKGIFFKPASIATIGTLKREFERLNEMRELAPEYVPKPIEIIRDKSSGKITGYSMPLVGGRSISEYLKASSKLPDWVEDQIIDFVNKIHKGGFVHGDFSKLNILVDETIGRIQVIDPSALGNFSDPWEKNAAYWLINNIFKHSGHKEGWDAHAEEKGIGSWNAESISRRP